MMSTASKNAFIILPRGPGVFTYSALARNATRRGIMAEIMMESRKDRWLEATITGPVAGKFSSPVTRARKTVRRIPVIAFWVDL